MRLTQFSNYALRTLMFAHLHDGRLCQCHEVADTFSISKAHIVKCVHQLGQWEFLECIRGRKGGFRLARPASEISVGQVIRKTEDSLALVQCFHVETNSCPLISGCHLKVALQSAMKNFLAELDALSIEDITLNKSQLLGLLDAVAEGEAAE